MKEQHSTAYILVIAATHDVCEYYRRVLQAEAFQVKIVTTQEATLTAIAPYHPDLILFDGGEVDTEHGSLLWQRVEQLKAVRETATIPLLVCTSPSLSPEGVNCVQLYQIETLSKPVQPDDVIRKVSALLTPFSRIPSSPLRLENTPGFYEAIVSSSDDAIVSKTLKGIITSWNRAAERLFGYSAQEAIGQSILLIIPPELHYEEDTILGKIRQGAHIEHHETVRVRKDGTRVNVLLSISPIKDRDGRIIGAAKIAHDITERKQGELIRLQLAALVESADVPIIGKTREGIITSWNRAAERMYGYSAQEAVGQSITIIFPADRQDEFVRIMERIGEGEQVDLYETARRRKDGTILPVSVSISPIRDHEGQIIGASDIAHDITEHKRSQAQERFLTQLSRVLASTLDYQETLANVARLAVPHLADWFAVDLINAEGKFELVEIAHKDPEKVHWARSLRERYPVDPEASTSITRIVRTGQSEFYPEITDELLVAGSRTEEELFLSRQVGYSSVILVPVIARGKTLGVISFITAESGKRFDKRDLAMMEEVGQRVGVALDNARLYHEVQRARDQFDIILQGVSDGILVYAPNHHVLYANEAAAQMSGFSSTQEMLAASVVEMIAPYELINEDGTPISHVQFPHLRVLAGEAEAQAVIGYRVRGTGEIWRWVSVTSRPVLGESGQVVMAISILHDITERMRIEHRKDEFISIASHELRTPITSLKGFTNVLQRHLAKQGDERVLYYLERMDRQLDKLTRLISELLDISRMRAGKLELLMEPIALDALIRETVENVQAATSTHHLLIEGNTGAYVTGDQERLGQVFINLLMNAIKYSPDAENVIVHLSQDENEERAIVGIQDFGIGIDKVDHEKIFERFYQAGNLTEKTYPGLGIGLYIAHDLVARHQGCMWVESSKGNGSTFFVALPCLSRTHA